MSNIGPDHCTTGLGSPLAAQRNVTVDPSDTVVSRGAVVITGGTKEMVADDSENTN